MRYRNILKISKKYNSNWNKQNLYYAKIKESTYIKYKFVTESKILNIKLHTLFIYLYSITVQLKCRIQYKLNCKKFVKNLFYIVLNCSYLL